MAQETYAAILRLVNPEVNKGFSVSFSLPNSNKPTTFVWNKENKFQAEIPTKITYVDDHKRTQVFRTNYAKDLLDAYGVGSKGKVKVLDFVKECKREEFTAKDFPEPKVFPEPKPEVESVTESKEIKKKDK